MFPFLVLQVEDEVDDIAKAEFEKFEQTLKESGKPTWWGSTEGDHVHRGCEGERWNVKGLFDHSNSLKCIEPTCQTQERTRK